MVRIGVIGCGTMGEAIVRGLSAQEHEFSVDQATVRKAARAEFLRSELQIKVHHSNTLLAQEVDVILLCTKPQAVYDVFTEEVQLALADKQVISICAGVSCAQLAALAPHSRVMRAMPNTPCLIQEGMTVISGGALTTEDDFRIAASIFDAVGEVTRLEEKHLNAVTGLSGSGPAFICVILEALADGGVRMGLPRDVATKLAATMTQGTARMVLQTGRHPAALKDAVTTPAGCTIAGLLTMEDGRIRSILARTIEEATTTAAKLGQCET